MNVILFWQNGPRMNNRYVPIVFDFVFDLDVELVGGVDLEFVESLLIVESVVESGYLFLQLSILLLIHDGLSFDVISVLGLLVVYMH